MPEIGFVKIVHKVEGAPGFPPVPAVTVQPGLSAWTPILRIEYADVGGSTKRDLGPGFLDGELGGLFGTKIPADVKARWLRVGKSDPTKETGLVVGTSRVWTAVYSTTIEFLTADDFPLELQLVHNGTAFPVRTAIAAIFVPALYIVSRLTIGTD